MQILTHHRFWLVAGLIVLNLVLFANTNARTVPAFMLIVGFLTLATLFWAAWYGFFSLLGMYGIHLQRKRRLALYAAGICGGLLALQSMGQLSGRDIMVMTPLLLIAYMYSMYAKSDRRDFSA